MIKHSPEDDAQTLETVRQAYAELCGCLNSLGGKTETSLARKFTFHTSRQMKVAAEGYIFLREHGGSDCSKLLVRPMIELMFRLKAVDSEPFLVYRILYGEWKRRTLWIRGAAERQGVAFDEEIPVQQWQSFKARCKKEFPPERLEEARLTVEDLAEKAGMTGYYEAFYRMYCTFTHGTLEAITGHLSDLSDREDNIAVALCVLGAIEGLVETGGTSPGLSALVERLDADRNRAETPPKSE